MTLVEKRLVNAYAILVLAGRRKLEEVPENLRNETEIRKSEIEIENLS